MANSKVKYKEPRQIKDAPWGNENSPGILSLPQDIIRFVDGENWRGLYREFMLLDVFDEKKKKITGKEYVWSPEVMEQFIEAIVKKLKSKQNGGKPKRTIKRNK